MIDLPNVTALYAALAFGICYLILKKYLFLPLGGILDARESEEREAQKAYAESLRALEQAVAAGEQKLSDARREALKVREGLRAEGMALLEEKLAKAREESSHQIDRGAREIAENATDLSRQLPERAVGLARELAEKILGRKLAA
jgi:F-type H+-transporting ATPase subunit b